MGLWFPGFVGRRGLARLKRLIRNQQFMGSNPIGGFIFTWDDHSRFFCQICEKEKTVKILEIMTIDKAHKLH